MIAGHFDYLAPTGVAEIVAALAEDPTGSALLAGGSWLVPSMHRGERAVRRVIDLRRAGLRGVGLDGDDMRLGACSTYTDLLRSDLVGRYADVLVQLAHGVTGGPQIVERCTIGGAAAAARPASDVPAALLLLAATATVAGPDGRRTLPVAELWAQPFTTTIAADEVLVDFRFPRAAPGTSFGYVKIKHSTGGWPIVTAAARVTRGEDGMRTGVQVSVGGATDVPFSVDLSQALTDDEPSDDALAQAARHAGSAIGPCRDDELAPGSYRQAVAPVAVRRALAQALRTPRATKELA